jgi:taurine--2-oxoglutarate transaminase
MESELEKFGSVQGKYLMQSWGIQEKYDPIPVRFTEGCWIHTTDGRKIFDLRSAHECINLGFRYPKILEAMRRQLESVIYVTDDFATRPTAALAQRLAEITPGAPGKRVWFGQSGAAAVEAAIKGARFYKYNQSAKKSSNDDGSPHLYPGSYKIISRYRSYHGATSGAMSVSGDPRRWLQEPYVIPGAIFAPEAFCYRCPLKHTYPDCDIACADYIDHIIEMEGGGEKVAAVIVEPVVGSNGIIPPPQEYLPRLREVCDKWAVLLIVDETMSGMGRTGKMFAFEHYDIIPDVIVLGKALGVYCPLSATIFSQQVANAFDENIFGHGQSYSGHALACAAGLASLDVLTEDGILEHCLEMGAYIESKLAPLPGKHPSIGDIRGLGLFWTIELVKDATSKEPLRQVNEKFSPTIVSEIARVLLEKYDVYIPADKYGVWIVPPLVVSKEEIDYLVEAIDQSLEIADNVVR